MNPSVTTPLGDPKPFSSPSFQNLLQPRTENREQPQVKFAGIYKVSRRFPVLFFFFLSFFFPFPFWNPLH